MSQNLFSDRLAEAMEKSGLRQSDLIRIAAEQGHKLGKSQLSQYLSGKVTPRAQAVVILAQALGVSEEWLAEGEAASQPEAAAQEAAARDAVAQSAPRGEERQEPKEGSRGTNTMEKGTAAGRQGEGSSMRQFKKSSKLDHVSYDVRGPALDEAMRMEEDGIHILKLNIGNPAPFGFRTPDEVVQDMASQLRDTEGYSDSRGLFAARKAIMQYDQLKGIPNVQMNDIYTGNGVSDLINLVMQAMVETGDEILVPSPDYPLWTACVTLAGGKAVHYLCDEQADWLPDLDDMRSKVTSNTKAIVIINPNNPTGALYPREVLEEIVEIAASTSSSSSPTRSTTAW